MQVWDTSGQERFRTITQTYYKNAKGVLLVYDCTEETSFENVGRWLEQLSQMAEHDIAKILVANKVDLTDQRKVSEQKGKELAREYKMEYLETSAKTG